MPGDLIPLCPVKIDIVGLHRRDIRGVLLQILVVVQGMRHLVVKGLPYFLRTDVIYKFRSRFYPHLGFHLPDEGIRVSLALVEALVNIIQISRRAICELKIDYMLFFLLWRT